MLVLVTSTANHSRLSPAALYTQLLPWCFVLDILSLSLNKCTFPKINLSKTSHVSHFHSSVNLPFLFRHKLIRLPKNRKKKIGWLNLSVSLPWTQLAGCQSSAGPSPAPARLTAGLLSPCARFAGTWPKSCPHSVAVAVQSFYSPKTWPWACCQPQVRLSYSVQCGSCLRFHFTLSSPWPACFLLPAMPHLFSRRPHFSLLQIFRTQRLTRFPALSCASTWSSVLHIEPLSAENDQADCILLDYFKKKTKAVSQEKALSHD